MLGFLYEGDENLDAKPAPPPVVIRGRVIPRQLPAPTPTAAYEQMAATMVQEHTAQSLIEQIATNDLGGPLLRALYEVEERTTVVAAIEAKLEELGETDDDITSTGS